MHICRKCLHYKKQWPLDLCRCPKACSRDTLTGYIIPRQTRLVRVSIVQMAAYLKQECVYYEDRVPFFSRAAKWLKRKIGQAK